MASLLPDQIIEQVYRSRDNALIFTALLFNYSCWDALVVKVVLVAFHRESLTRACLTVAHNGSIITSDSIVDNISG